MSGTASGGTWSHANSELARHFENEAREALLRLTYSLVQPGEVSAIETRGENARLNRVITNKVALLDTAAICSAPAFCSLWKAKNPDNPNPAAFAGHEDARLQLDFLAHVNFDLVAAAEFAKRIDDDPLPVQIVNQRPPTKRAAPTLTKKLSDADVCPETATSYVVGEISSDWNIHENKILQLERVCTAKLAEFRRRHGIASANPEDVFAFVYLVFRKVKFPTINKFIEQNSSALPILKTLNDRGRVLALPLRSKLRGIARSRGADANGVRQAATLSDTLEQVQVQLAEAQLQLQMSTSLSSARSDIFKTLVEKGKTPAEIKEYFDLYNEVVAEP